MMRKPKHFTVIKYLNRSENVVIFLFVFFIGVLFFEIYDLTKSEGDSYHEYFDLPGNDVSRTLETLNTNLPQGRWQPIVGTRLKFLVYAAHYDNRVSPPVVRVIGAVQKGAGTVNCMVFPRKGSSEHNEVPANIKVLSGDSSSLFTAVLVTCQLTPQSGLPWAVAVMSDSVHRDIKILRVNGPYPPLDIGISPSIVACVQPITLFYSQPIRLIEFIEMNTLLGVNHFMFYNQSMTPEISCLLADYTKQGRVTVMPWNTDLWNGGEKTSQPESMYAAYNDCLFRTINRFTYTAFLALDEYLVPKKAKTLQDFLNTKKFFDPVYAFSSAYFFTEWPDDRSNLHGVVTHYMMTAFKTQRTIIGYAQTPHGLYTHLCRPESVLEIGAKYVPKLLPGAQIVKSDSSVLSHLYLPCEGSSINANCTSVASVADLSMIVYTERLTVTMLAQWTRAMPKCTLHDDVEGDSVKPRIVVKRHVPVLVF